MLKLSVLSLAWVLGVAQPDIAPTAAAGDAGLALAMTLATSRPTTRATPRATPQDGQESDVDRHRKRLLMPGPDAREERETAVHALLVMKDPRAHDAIQEVLARGDDSDRLSRFVLQTLRPRMQGAADPVFADPAMRPKLVASYCRVLVRYFADDPELRPAAAPESLRGDVLGCLRSLGFVERRQVFTALFEDSDVRLVRAALVAAGGCRDLGLAPDIAKRIGDSRVGATAQVALQRLTFARSPFVDEQAFLDWQRNHSERAYVDLAEDAALARREDEDRAARAAADALRTQTAKLVRALASAENESWVELRAEVLGGASAEALVAYLEAMRAVFATKARLGGVTSDRQAFAAALRDRLVAAVAPQEYALLLENFAYIAVREVVEQRDAALALLRAGLARPEIEVRRAACRGLARYPSIENRAEVIRTAQNALAAKDPITLQEALACLHATGWFSPKPTAPDRAEWLALLRDVFLATDLPAIDGQPARHREHALDVAIVADPDGALVGDVFPLLLEVSRDDGQPVSLRQQMLIRLQTFARDEARARDYVDHMLALVGDDDPEVRRHVAEQLMRLPEAGKDVQRQWHERILDRLAGRLLDEADRRVLAAVVRCMLHIGQEPGLVEMPIGRFRDAVITMTKDSPTGGEPFRRSAIAEGLTILGGAPGRTVAQWTAAAAGLADLRARDGLRSVLERQDAIKLATESGPNAIAAMQLVVAAALLRPADTPWSRLAREAEEVRVAIEALARLEAPIRTPECRLLRVQVLGALPGREAETVATGTAELADQANPLAGEARVQVILSVITARFALEQLDAARTLLAELDALGANVPEVPALWLELAERHLRAGRPAIATEILPSILQKTTPEAPLYRRVFLLDAEARLALDPTGSRERVRALLRDNAALFEGDAVPRALVDRFEAIRRQVES